MEDIQFQESIVVRGTAESEPKHIAVGAFNTMNHFRRSGKLCDIKIWVEMSEFLAHKIVLASLSPYFEAMFTSDYKESQKTVIRMTDINANIMSLILDYFYTGDIGLTITNSKAVLLASDYLQVEPLVEICCNFILRNMDPHNCLDIYTSVGKYFAKMKKKSKDYAVCYFSSVCQEKAFLELDNTSLIDIIGSDSLAVHSEETVFNAVIKWFQFNEKDRLQHLPEVLRHVRLALLAPDFLKSSAETVSEILTSPECMLLLQEAERLSQNLDSCSPLTRRRSASLLEAFLVYGEHLPSDFTRRDNAWKLFNISKRGLVLKELKQPKYFDYCYVSRDQSLLLAPHRDTIWRYDSSRNDWQPIAPLQKRRFSFGLGEVDGFWYAMGGFIPGSDYHTRIFNHVERYQPSSNAWVPVAPMPEGVMSPAVVSLQGVIYVLGGENKSGTQVDLVQKYDPCSNSWSLLAPFQVLGSNFKACGLNDCIYLFFDKESSPIQVYNVPLSAWEECPRNKHRFASGPVVFNGSIYILSKSSDDSPILERFSPTDGIWKDVGSFSYFRPQSIFRSLHISLPRKVKAKEEFIMRLDDADQ